MAHIGIFIFLCRPFFVERLEQLVLSVCYSVCYFFSYCLLTPLMSPKDKKCKLID